MNTTLGASGDFTFTAVQHRVHVRALPFAALMLRIGIPADALVDERLRPGFNSGCSLEEKETEEAQVQHVSLCRLSFPGNVRLSSIAYFINCLNPLLMSDRYLLRVPCRAFSARTVGEEGTAPHGKCPHYP